MSPSPKFLLIMCIHVYHVIKCCNSAKSEAHSYFYTTKLRHSQVLDILWHSRSDPQTLRRIDVTADTWHIFSCYTNRQTSQHAPQGEWRSTRPLFTLADICLRYLSATEIFVDHLSKHAERVRARRVGVADLCDACSYWSTVGQEFAQMSPTKGADVFFLV